MSYNCEPKLPMSACADDIFVNVRNFPAIIAPTGGSGIPGEIRVPVKVAGISVTEPIKDSIFISEGFEDVKSIQRKVILTQAHVTQHFLYVEGFIIKNVGYATPIFNDDPMQPCQHECKVTKNQYNDLTAKIDFHLTVPVDLSLNNVPQPSSTENASYFTDCMRPCDTGSSGELHCEKYYAQTVTLNEPYTAKLEGYSIAESLILKKEDCNTPWRYDTILEKLELTLDISIIQVQQIGRV